MHVRHVVAVALGLMLAGCGGTDSGEAAGGEPGHGEAVDADVALILAETRRVHGGQGPWAVAGYRIGAHAMGALGVPRGHMGLRVHHHSPSAVQYSCITDGLQAATGASLGKHTLAWTEAPLPDLRAEVGTASGETLVYTLTDGFVARYTDVPFEELDARGAEVARLDDTDIFTVERRTAEGVPAE
jgi:formylmethanofuran dehydrogenase subunit E